MPGVVILANAREVCCHGTLKIIKTNVCNATVSILGLTGRRKLADVTKFAGVPSVTVKAGTNSHCLIGVHLANPSVVAGVIMAMIELVALIPEPCISADAVIPCAVAIQACHALTGS